MKRISIYLVILEMFIVCGIACKKQPKAPSRVDPITKHEMNPQEPVVLPKIKQALENFQKVTFINKTAEISEGFSKESNDFFAGISDICIDKKNNLFVADSRLHRIFIFNKSHVFLKAFGKEGQGPGEFAGNLRISAGNDGNIYVTDNGRYKVMIFSSNGDYVNEFNMLNRVDDIAVANSRGDVYLVSQNGYKLIDCFNNKNSYLGSYIDFNYQTDFQTISPPKSMLRKFLTRPSALEIHKMISDFDNLFVVINNSQIAVRLDKDNKLLNQFRIEHPRFLEDYTKRQLAAHATDGWINCFGSMFLDYLENLYVCYFNEILGIPEIYCFERNGHFIETIRLRESKNNSNRIIYAIDDFGLFYGIDEENARIEIYAKYN